MRKHTDERTQLVRVQAQEERPPPLPTAWRPFRFHGLEKVSRTQVLLARKLGWVLPAAAAGKVEGAVLTRLQEIFEHEVQLTLDYAHVVPPHDVRRILADPTFLATVVAAPHKARGFFEVDLTLAHAAIDLLLGGGGEAAALRPLTDIEEGVMSFMVLEMLRAVAPHLDPKLPRLRLESVAKGADEAAAALAQEGQVVVLQLRALIGPHAGHMRLFLPASLVELAESVEDGPKQRAARAVEAVRHVGRLSAVKAWLRAEIGHIHIAGKDFAALRQGDVALVDDVTCRVDKEAGGTAALRVGLGQVGSATADILVDSGHYQATIKGFAWRDAATEAEGAPGAPAEAEAPAEKPEGKTSPGTEELLSEEAVEEVASEGADLLNDVPLHIAVELARVPVSAEDIVGLKVGQVIDLKKSPKQPVDLSVNGAVVARGELVELEGQLGVRILSLAR